MPMMFVSKRHTRRRIRQKFHYFEPIKFHERNPRKRTRSNPPSLVQASGFPLHRHTGIHGAVIKLKGFAISSLEYSIQKSGSGCILKGLGRQHVRVLFAFDSWIHESNVKQGIRFVERRKLIPLFNPYTRRIVPLFGNITPARPFLCIPPIRKILDFSYYAVSAEIRGKHRG